MTMDDQETPNTFETRSRPRDPDPGRLATIVFGLIVIAIGLWFFAERSLDIDLPEIEWGALWPLILVALGIWILLGAGRRRRS
jgi:Domain of unknown function (DUF5668)